LIPSCDTQQKLPESIVLLDYSKRFLNLDRAVHPQHNTFPADNSGQGLRSLGDEPLGHLKLPIPPGSGALLLPGTAVTAFTLIVTDLTFKPAFASAYPLVLQPEFLALLTGMLVQQGIVSSSIQSYTCSRSPQSLFHPQQVLITNFSLFAKELYQGIKQGFQTAGQPLAAKPCDLMIN